MTSLNITHNRVQNLNHLKKDLHFYKMAVFRDIAKLTIFDFVGVLAAPLAAGIYMSRVNYRNTRTKSQICSKLIIKTPEQCNVITDWLGIDKFTVNLNVSNIS